MDLLKNDVGKTDCIIRVIFPTGLRQFT